MATEGPPRLDLTHVRLLVTDYGACFRFYRDVLGFDVTWGDAESGYADFDTGETTLAIFTRRWMAEAIGTTDRPADAEAQDDVALVFAVDDVDGAYDRMRDGVAFVTEPHDEPGWGIRVAHLRDPDGTLLEITEPLEGG